MDELIAQISEKTGLATSQVVEVVGMVRDHMVGVLPDDLTEQVKGYMGAAGAMTGSAVDATKSAAGSATEATKGAAGTATGMAGGAWDATKGVVGDALGGDDK